MSYNPNDYAYSAARDRRDEDEARALAAEAAEAREEAFHAGRCSYRASQNADEYALEMRVEMADAGGILVSVGRRAA